MSIWRIRSRLVSDYKDLFFAKERDSWITIHATGKSLAQNWQPIAVEFQDDDKSDICDFPWLSGSYVCNLRAKTVIQPLVTDNVEFLPLLCADHQFYFLMSRKLLIASIMNVLIFHIFEMVGSKE